MDLKEEEQVGEGIRKGRKKKEKNVCKTWYNDLGNSNVFLPQVYRQKIVQNYRRENGKSW